MKKLIKSYKFWVSLAGALGILTVAIGKCFGISINAQGVEEIVMAICGVLIVFGIVKKDKTKDTSQTEKSQEENSKEETKNENSLEK